ncbi:transglutaminase TgpA family protein [Amycolatopsis magusensis]|uniref:transglutaminase TgpA family protein n=1 Tax=Amycolatopsis magusensis TaxID=882444 RepID=UPI003C2D117A
MTTAPPAPPIPHTPTERPEPPAAPWVSSIFAPLAAGLATICASTSITGVVGGAAWFGYVIVAVILVACTGLALRTLRTPTLLVALAQLLVLSFLVTGVFTSHGILGIFPGPAALSEFQDVLSEASEQIRMGLPPVEPTPPILCLVVIAIGLVAVLVDTFAVAASAPAATGLILLCVYAVPASLSDGMLPWWTFLLGAAAFAGLLAVDGSHRHRRWRNRTAPGLGASPAAASAPVAVVAVALSLGLVAGGTITAIGTVGSIPGDGPGGEGNRPTGGLGINPFTQLRGLLDQGQNVELFRVRGLNAPGDRRMLRAFTLNYFEPNQGWKIADEPRMPPGVPANQPSLPLAPGDDGSGETKEIQIEPINWVDVWLPVYGAPRSLRNISDGWQYDSVSGAVYSEAKRQSPPYVQEASLRVPTKDALRGADTEAEQIPSIYTRLDQVDPRVVALTQQLTENATNDFDRATAVWNYFNSQNGFTYDTRTASAADSDALADFLLNGKRGYCEQFASAMAVMLRTLNIPSRVAIGFTPGYTTADYRSITSQDAHAWVEAYFGELGWVTFDPTPLADSRGYIPPYLRPDEGPDSEAEAGSPSASTSAAPPRLPGEETNTPDLGAQPEQPEEEQRPGEGPDWVLWLALAALVAGFVVAGVQWQRADRAKKQRQRPPPDPSAPVQTVAPPGSDTWLPLLAAGLLIAGVGLLAWLWTALLAVPLVLALLAAAGPSTVREVVRRQRLQVIGASGPEAANAAWKELLDECRDRGVPVEPSDTVRTTAQKIAQRHRLDDEGKGGLRTVVGVVERSWYGSSPGSDPTFGRAFDDVRTSLTRNSPMSWRGRLFPRSLFRRR